MTQRIPSKSTKALAQLLTDAVQQLTTTVFSFSEADFNRVPFSGSWTGAQVTAHVIKSSVFIHQIINGATEHTLRNPETHIPYLSDLMANMDVKGKSAANLLPGDQPLSRRVIQVELSNCQKDLLWDIAHTNLSKTCTAMEFPGIGYLTGIEFISFAAFHTERHNRQLQNIYRVLNGGA